MNYPSIRIEGAILSPDILDLLEDRPGQRPSDFGLDTTVRVKDEIARAWADAQDYWRIFQRKIEAMKLDTPATTETRNLWIVPLLGLLGYQLEYQPRAVELNGKAYAISHRAVNRDSAPIHIVGYREPAGLDRKPDKAALRISAHGMVQEYLNLRDELYGIVTNGRILRLLRDTSRLVKLTYLEFDVERIFTEGLFADFAVLFRLLHATRLPASHDEAAQSLIERYHQDSLDSGARIREGLSEAVENAIRDFANGFLFHRDNDALRRSVDTKELTPNKYYLQLLRLIYRILFLIVIEERGLVFPPSATPAQREIYDRYYSLQRLRRLSEKRYLADRRNHDLWIAMRSTFSLFEAGGVGQKLGVAPLAGDLFDREALGSLKTCQLGNDVLLGCLRSLGMYENPMSHQTIRVNYAALNVEEFGSVYEGLLEYAPVFVPTAGRTEFAFVKGDKRAATGSHYTPDDLVQPLIKHSLDYLIADKLNEPDPAAALLELRVADVACGSGHILLAAARRIGAELAIVRTGEEQPSPTAFRTAVRDVIRKCVYGVDLNPLAVELCKVALWLEAHVPGEPLNFLDHQIRCGNAIVGFAREEELERGIPDEAFATMPSDDKEVAAELRARNKKERKDAHQEKLPLSPGLQTQLEAIVTRFHEVAGLPDATPEQYAAKKREYEKLTTRDDAKHIYWAASLPVAQFYLAKTPENESKLITHEDYARYRKHGLPPSGQVTANAYAIAHQKGFFHWFLEFPEIIGRGGFDCILGNPPYLSGTDLSSTYGYPFCHYVKWEYAPAGLSDLVVYFVRRIFDLLRPDGFMAFITTNSIVDGDNRRDGLQQVIERSGQINMAVRGIKWPGRANLVVSLVAIHKGEWKRARYLDGDEVGIITTHFENTSDIGEPRAIAECKDWMFKGFDILGDGFFLLPSEVTIMLNTNERNKEVIFPVLNGQEINNYPDQNPTRSIINFFDWSETQASQFDRPFRRVEELVKPVRATNNRQVYRDRWWQYCENRPGLRRAAAHINCCFVICCCSKYLSFSRLPSDVVYTKTLYVLALDRWDLYAVLQSTFHEVWARKYSGALETRLYYSPTDCFETFAFPVGLWSEYSLTLEDIGERYHEHRKSLMLSLWLGLTDVYNLFHARDLSPAKVAKVSKKSAEEAERGYVGLLELRRLHVELDVAIRDAYGWQDLDLSHDFHEVETLPENDRIRYTISPSARKEVLKRLLALNHERAAAETEAAEASAKVGRKKRGKKVVGAGEDVDPRDRLVFPWDGRESYVTSVIPQLVALQPGREYEFYTIASYYASYPEAIRADLRGNQRSALLEQLDALNLQGHAFDQKDKVRPEEIRHHLFDKIKALSSGAYGVRLIDSNVGAIAVPDQRTLLTIALTAAEVYLKALESREPVAIDRKKLMASGEVLALAV